MGRHMSATYMKQDLCNPVANCTFFYDIRQSIIQSNLFGYLNRLVVDLPL